jgi:hypothetical protein
VIAALADPQSNRPNLKDRAKHAIWRANTPSARAGTQGRFPEYQLSTARAPRPAVVIRTILTLIILPPARNFPKDRVT